MKKIYSMISSLKFDETPDYKQIIFLLTQAINQMEPKSQNTLNIDLLGEEGMHHMTSSKLSKKPSIDAHHHKGEIIKA